MAVRSRRLTGQERQALLGLDESCLPERVALGLLQKACRSRTPFEIRGVKFPRTKFRWPKARFTHTSFVDSDLGSPFITWRPFRARVFDGCRFSDVSMDGLHVSHAVFRGCSFDRVVFGKRFRGYLGKCHFEDCSFDECSLDYVRFLRCTFARCQWRCSRATRVWHERCTIRDTAFGGRFGVIHFVDSSLERVDLSACEMKEATLLSNTYRGVTVPSSEAGYFVAPGALEPFDEVVAERFSSDGKRWLEELAGACDLLYVSPTFLEGFNRLESDLIKGFCYPRRVVGDFTTTRAADHAMETPRFPSSRAEPREPCHGTEETET